VSIDGCISGGARQAFVIFVGDVVTGLWISEPFAESKIYDVNLRLFCPNSHQEIVRLHVSVQEVLRMHVLDAADHLIP